MSYTVIPAGDIVAGKPTKEEIFDQIRTNQESFNTDIEALKQTSKIDIFDINFIGGLNSYSLSELDSLTPIFKAPVNASMVSVVMTLLEDSTSGTLSLDIEKSTDDGINWSSVLTANVTLTGTTIGSKSGAVSFQTGGEDFNQNDLLRIVIKTVQVDQGDFHVSVYGEVA